MCILAWLFSITSLILLLAYPRIDGEASDAGLRTAIGSRDTNMIMPFGGCMDL